jgi:hypothetical protein
LLKARGSELDTMVLAGPLLRASTSDTLVAAVCCSRVSRATPGAQLAVTSHTNG